MLFFSITYPTLCISTTPCLPILMHQTARVAQLSLVEEIHTRQSALLPCRKGAKQQYIHALLSDLADIQGRPECRIDDMHNKANSAPTTSLRLCSHVAVARPSHQRTQRPIDTFYPDNAFFVHRSTANTSHQSHHRQPRAPLPFYYHTLP
jgi:hypothetical protein